MSDQLKIGDRSDAVAVIANTLTRLGIHSNPTDLFDEGLAQAIKAFQQERGLTATGLINEITQRCLDEARWKLGDRILALQSDSLMRGDDVSNLQDRLIQMGFNCGKVRINNVPVEMIPQEIAREVILAPLEIAGDLREKIDISLVLFVWHPRLLDIYQNHQFVF